jgi:hypothetical protein
LAANDFFRHKLTTKDGKLPLQREMLAGGLAGLFQGSILQNSFSAKNFSDQFSFSNF